MFVLSMRIMKYLPGESFGRQLREEIAERRDRMKIKSRLRAPDKLEQNKEINEETNEENKKMLLNAKKTKI